MRFEHRLNEALDDLGPTGPLPDEDWFLPSDTQVYELHLDEFGYANEEEYDSIVQDIISTIDHLLIELRRQGHEEDVDYGKWRSIIREMLEIIVENPDPGRCNSPTGDYINVPVLVRLDDFPIPYGVRLTFTGHNVKAEVGPSQ